MSRRDHSLSVFSGTFWCAREPPGIVVTNPGASAAAIGGGDDFDACCLPPLLPASNGSSHGRRRRRVHSSGHSRCDRPVSVINLIEGLCCPSSLPLTPLPLFPSRRGERRRGGGRHLAYRWIGQASGGALFKKSVRDFFPFSPAAEAEVEKGKTVQSRSLRPQHVGSGNLVE